MKFRMDHDLHIHSLISPCANHDPRQTKEAILSYGIASGLKLLCVTDHLWDEKAPCAGFNGWLNAGCSLEKGRELLPLPQSKHCRFLFGMEADMDLEGNLAVTREEMDRLDFIIFSPSHLHMKTFTVPEDLDGSPEVHKAWYLKRMDQLLRQDLPYGKIGLAHPTCGLACTEGPQEMFDLITDREYEEMWTRVRDKGMGVEINPDGILSEESPEDAERALRPYKIAKAVGCKFYLGGDCHTPDSIPRVQRRWKPYIDGLNLQEEDKIDFVRAALANVDKKALP